MSATSAWAAVLTTILLTVYGQLIIKWRVIATMQALDGGGKIVLLSRLLLDPWVLTGFIAAFLAAVSWMLAMTKLPLSLAYPFTSMAFLLVMIFGVAFLSEALTLPKVLGTALIVVGLIVLSRG